MSLWFIRYFRVHAIVVATRQPLQTMPQPEAKVTDLAPSPRQLKYFKIKTTKVYPIVDGKICTTR